MFHYQGNHLFAGNVRLEPLSAEFGSPLYIYDAADIRLRCREFLTAFSPLHPHIHYSIKANGNLSLLRLLRDQGLGFDIVSGGELTRLQTAEIEVSEIGFAGVGKTEDEIRQALEAGIGFFNVESAGELARIAAVAQSIDVVARLLLRLNPDVDAGTHKHITTGKASNKFGLDFETAAMLCDRFAGHAHMQIVGFHMHLGSQIKKVEPYVTATRKMLEFIAFRRAAGQRVAWLNLGGGFGIGYGGENPLYLKALAESLTPLLKDKGLQIILEPGRSLIARAGLLLMQVQYVKQGGGKRFVIVDSGMHHLIRPALYGGWHKIWPVNQAQTSENLVLSDVVGPICESTDFLAQDRALPAAVQPGDILALFDAGAYGFVMASTYNAHPRPAEVLVDGDTYRLIRKRETYEDLIGPEQAYL